METRPLDEIDRAMLDLGIPPKPPLPPDAPATKHQAVPGIPPKPPLPGTAEPSPRTTETSAPSRVPHILLAAYVVALTLIAIWPVPVDRGAGPAIGVITRIFPILTYARIEFGANILLFVPLGVLLALILHQRFLVVPIAVVTTVAIESVQGIALSLRTPSVMDIVANVTGACIGLLLVTAVEWWQRRAVASG
jgi:hypothetical protein